MFGNKPIENGKDLQDCWTLILKENKEEIGTDITQEVPIISPSFVSATAPRMLPNQQAIILMANLLAANSRWVYICQPSGTGKTTLMLELGYIMGRSLRSSNSKSEVNIRLIVPSTE